MRVRMRPPILLTARRSAANSAPETIPMQDTTSAPRGYQARALWLSTIAFTVCFAVWTIFSIIGVQIKKDLGLSDTQFGLLIGPPILTRSLIRLMLRILASPVG